MEEPGGAETDWQPVIERCSRGQTHWTYDTPWGDWQRTGGSKTESEIAMKIIDFAIMATLSSSPLLILKMKNDLKGWLAKNSTQK